MGFWEGFGNVVNSMADAMNKASERIADKADRLESEGRLSAKGYEMRDKARNYMSKYNSYKSRRNNDEDEY